MDKKTKYLIIGIGKFGLAFAERLVKEKIKESNIYMIDENPETIKKLSSMHFTNIAIGKVSDISSIESVFPLDEIDILVIGSSDFQFSTEIAYSLKNEAEKHNIKKIYAKARNEMHKKILENFGIDSQCIVIPEQEIGNKMALKSFFDTRTEIIDFGSDFSIISLVVKNETLKGKTIREISDKWHQDSNEERNWNIISITDNYDQITVATSEKVIYIDYKIAVFCSKEDRKKVYKYFSGSNVSKSS